MSAGSRGVRNIRGQHSGDATATLKLEQPLKLQKLVPRIAQGMQRKTSFTSVTSFTSLTTYKDD
jgi:hypothetical protein